jgi:hypothetical protein
MNNGTEWSAAAVVTTLLWVLVVVLIMGMWVAFGLGHQSTGTGIGFTGCATSAAAAVMHIRRFACRQMALIRALHGPEERRTAPERLQPVR